MEVLPLHAWLGWGLLLALIVVLRRVAEVRERRKAERARVVRPYLGEVVEPLDRDTMGF